MDGLDRDTLFVALTRPQMLAGVPYGFAIANAFIVTELFLVTGSLWVVLAAPAVHLAGWAVSLREPRYFGLFLVMARRCPRITNRRIWRCNSYPG